MLWYVELAFWQLSKSVAWGEAVDNLYNDFIAIPHSNKGDKTTCDLKSLSGLYIHTIYKVKSTVI